MSNAARQMTFLIYRFDPAKDAKPRYQEYTINTADIGGQMLLNALESLKEQQDPSLVFRRSCGEGVCGSDGMNINGTNGLACVTRLVDLPAKVRLAPLPGFAVIRDLIVDMEQFFSQYKKAKPFLVNHQSPPDTERLQSPADRVKLNGLYECILCACCSSSCPSFWWNPDKFIGPAGLLAAYRFIADTRDDDKAARLEALKDPFSVFRCRSIMNCVNVCPKGLNPTEAIRKIRSEMIAESGDI